MLAGLVKNPTGYDPTNDPNRARDRRDTVLARMAELNVISRSEADQAKKRPLGLEVDPLSNGCVSSAAPFFCDYAVQYLLADKALGKTDDERRRLLFGGGLTIKTTIDPRFQRAADTLGPAPTCTPRDQAIGGLAMVQPGTGEVRALAQSRPMGTQQEEGPDLPQLRRAPAVRRRQRVPGRLDVQGVRARRCDQAGHPAVHDDQLAADGQPAREQLQDLRRQLPEHRHVAAQNSTGPGTFDLYTGTQRVGEHLLRPARAAHRPVRARSRWPGRWASLVPESTAWCPRSPSASPTPTR